MMGVLILLVILTILSSFKCITTGQYDAFYYGDPAINRTHVDGWTNVIYIPEPHKSISKDGTLIGWKVYFRSVKPITCQIWHPATKPNYYKLIGQTVFTPSASGVQQTDLTGSSQFSVNSGDLVGFYFGNGSTIPFTKYMPDCTGIEFTKYIHPGSPKTAGSAYPFKEKLSWGPCRKYSIQAIIKFADTNTFYHGDPTINRTHVDGWTNGIYIPEPHKSIPKDGTLIGWKVYFRSVKPITCQIWRPATKPNYYELIGQTVFTPSASGIQQKDLAGSSQFSVNNGDLVGFNFYNGSTIPFTEYTPDCTGIEFTKYIQPGAPKTVGSLYLFKVQSFSWGPCRKYSIQAIIKDTTDGRSVHDVAFYKPCTKFPKMMNKNAGLAVDGKGETCTYLSNSTTWSVNLTSARTVMDVNISGYVYKFDKALGYLQSVNAKLESKGRLVIFAPNQNLTDVSSGEWYLTKWQVYLQRWFQSNPLVLQLWRPSGKDTYRLVHSHTVALRKKKKVPTATLR